jgi:glycosyltransferase involved in cell wall biosynthesis
VTDYGLLSETFVADLIEETDGLGWRAHLLAGSVERRDVFPFPPDERVIVGWPAATGLQAVEERIEGRRRFAPVDLDALAATGAEVIHAHHGWSGVGAAQLSRALGLPLIVQFHGSDVFSYPRLGRRLPYRRLVSRAHRYRRTFPQIDCAIVVSSFLERALRDLGYAGRIEVLPVGARLDRLPLRRTLPPSEPLRLLFIGRLVHRKGLDLILRAMTELRPRFPGLQLDVVGDGSEASTYREMVRTLGLGANVTFHGAQPREVGHGLLRESHALVLPSRTMPDGESETLGVVLLEAMAIGVPVVASRHGGIPDTVPPELRAELVPEDDATALAERLARVLGAPDEWPERAAVGRAWVEHAFDWAQLSRRIAGLYEELAGDGARRRR